jgi:hypothetical protein
MPPARLMRGVAARRASGASGPRQRASLVHRHAIPPGGPSIRRPMSRARARWIICLSVPLRNAGGGRRGADGRHRSPKRRDGFVRRTGPLGMPLREDLVSAFAPRPLSSDRQWTEIHQTLDVRHVIVLDSGGAQGRGSSAALAPTSSSTESETSTSTRSCRDAGPSVQITHEIAGAR